MVLPLIALAAALVSKGEQDAAQVKAEQNDIWSKEAATLAAIQAQRAARAGDSGYMQTAARGMTGYPVPEYNMNSSKTLQEVGKALMSQKDQPKDPSKSGAANDSVGPEPQEAAFSPLQGTTVNSGNYAGADYNNLDDEFANYV